MSQPTTPTQNIYFTRVSASIVEIIIFFATLQLLLTAALIPAVLIGGIIQQSNPNMGRIVGFIFIILGILLSIAYLIDRIAKNKQMKGYSIFKLRVVNTNGTELSYKQWVLRTLLKSILLIPSISIFYITLIPLFVSQGKRDLVDYLMNTQVEKMI